MSDPSRTTRVETSPAVLAPITLHSSDDSSVVIESIAAAAAGATGVDLTIPDPQLALRHGLAVADHVAETAGLRVFVRADVPLSTGPHTRICSDGHCDRFRSVGSCVVDLGIDRLGLPPDARELASYWPSVSEGEGVAPFLISTTGFDTAVDGEVMALATLAAMREATAITTDRLRTVRRVVDTVAAVIGARGAA